MVAFLFGFLVPYLKGLEFLDSLLLLAYSALSLFFVAPMVVDSVEAAPDKRPALNRLFRAVAIGWGAGVSIVILGIATVSFQFGRLVAPPAAIGLSLALLSLLGCLFVAALSAWVAIRLQNPDAAKARLRIGFLLLLVAVLGLPRLLNEEHLNWLLGALTPSGMIRATMLIAPLVALASVILLAKVFRR